MSSVLPEPGGPSMSSCARGGRDHHALGHFLAPHVGVVVVVVRQRAEQLLEPRGHRIDVQVPGEEGGRFGQRRHGITSSSSTTAALAALVSGTTSPRRPTCRAAAMAIDRTPFAGRMPPSERQFTDHRILFEPIRRQLPTTRRTRPT